MFAQNEYELCLTATNSNFLIMMHKWGNSHKNTPTNFYATKTLCPNSPRNWYLKNKGSIT